MKKYYSSYKYLLKKENELGVNAPEELMISLFGSNETEVTEEVANNYKSWTYNK
jgi:hypothetical protein